MKLTHEEVRQVLSIISESSFDSIEIKMGEIAISASKSGPLRAESVAPAPPTPQAPVGTQQAEPPTPPRAAAAPKASDVADEGLIEVTVWVPVDLRPWLRSMAAGLCAAWFGEEAGSERTGEAAETGDGHG